MYPYYILKSTNKKIVTYEATLNVSVSKKIATCFGKPILIHSTVDRVWVGGYRVWVGGP